jgi:hypothetical protein
MTDSPPGWLTETSLDSRRSFITGFGFVALTVVIAMVAEWIIPQIPAKLNLAFAQNIVQLQPGLSLFFAWDLAAILSMLVYFAVYWARMFAPGGALKEGGTVIPLVGTAIALLVVGLLCLIIAFLAGIAFALSIPLSMPTQLIFLTLAAYLFWWADRRIMIKHPNRKIQIEFKLFVEFVDLPMAICFTVLTAFYFLYIKPNNIQQFSAFMSGAIAFQIIAFNVAFAFLLRFTEVISHGRTSILLTSDGEFARDYPDFKNGWWIRWSAPSPAQIQPDEPAPTEPKSG